MTLNICCSGKIFTQIKLIHLHTNSLFGKYFSPQTNRLFGGISERPFSSSRKHFLVTPQSFLKNFSSKSEINCKSIEDVVNFMKNGVIKRILVMVGAGLSTSSGIPDFRTPGTGLYDNLQKYDLPYPEAIFDINYFRSNQQPFFSLARELYPSGYYLPNEGHYFVRLLQEKGLLVRMYTQNIDGLERLAGIDSENLVEAHGSFHTATCQACHKQYAGHLLKDEIMTGQIPVCRSAECKGVIKPDVVFFGENLPHRFYQYMNDLKNIDLLIVIGTSLEVYPFAAIADSALTLTPRILFNKVECGSFIKNPKPNDIIVKGDIVEQIWDFCNLLSWTNELASLLKKGHKEICMES